MVINCASANRRQHGRSRGFTLVEILIVISIIVLLMSLLIPAIGAAMRAVKSTTTQSRIDTLAAAVMEYGRRFGNFPPDQSPDMSMNCSADGGYYPYHYPDGSIDGQIGNPPYPPVIFNHGNWLDRPYGGKMLAYFLMGPYGGGWHRPKTQATTDKEYRHRFLSAEWDVPSGISDFLANRPVVQGLSGSYDAAKGVYTGQPFAVFLDTFGLEGNNGGTIGYIRANQYSSSDRWTEHNGAFHSAMYGDCRSHPSYPGDDKGVDQLTKMLAQCPEGVGFALISPGPDRRFGYRVTVMTFSGTDRKGSWSNLANGVIDDIANFPLK